MDENVKLFWKTSAEQLIKNLKARNINAFYCETGEEALQKLKELVPEGSEVGFSGSQTLKQIGAVEALSKRNKVHDHNLPGVKQEEKPEIRRKGANAEYYLTSTNAITLDGRMVTFSAHGNRIAGFTYAKKKTAVVVGMNKLCFSLEEAVSRARNYAAPLNSKRLDLNTPCKRDGVCKDEECRFPEFWRCCCSVLITEGEVQEDRLNVILVGEELGY